MSNFNPTKAACLRSADSIEADCKDQLAAWIVLRKTQKYSDGLKLVANLRHAAALPDILSRREYLINAGVGGL